MAKFFVGQRVRVKFVCRPENKVLVGLETVVADLCWMPTWDEPIYGVREKPIVFDFGEGWVGFSPDQLEPILPSGHRASDFSFHELMDKCRQGEGVEA